MGGGGGGGVLNDWHFPLSTTYNAQKLIAYYTLSHAPDIGHV